MTPRERVYATLDFQRPDRVPTDFWALPIVTHGREEEIGALLQQYPPDIVRAPWRDALELPTLRHVGVYQDGWGCSWEVGHVGTVGEVMNHPLAREEALRDYTWPSAGPLLPEASATENMAREDAGPPFVLGGWLRPFERMLELRGVENLYVDMAEEGETFCTVRDHVFSYYAEYLALWLKRDVDGVAIADDWGSARGLMMSPEQWRRTLKPHYQKLIDQARAAGVRVFVHSDGWILDLLPDLIEMGVSAINSQIFLMGLDRLKPYAGHITFWGELDQELFHPTVMREEIITAAQQMVDALWQEGGVIGLSQPPYTVPLKTVEWAMDCWGQVRVP